MCLFRLRSHFKIHICIWFRATYINGQKSDLRRSDSMGSVLFTLPLNNQMWVTQEGNKPDWGHRGLLGERSLSFKDQFPNMKLQIQGQFFLTSFISDRCEARSACRLTSFGDDSRSFLSWWRQQEVAGSCSDTAELTSSSAMTLPASVNEDNNWVSVGVTDRSDVTLRTTS